jgi:ERCC4-type nuclease
MVIVIDSREQVNYWITDYFDARLIEYESKIKLDYGDYSFKLKACPEYGITEDIYFTDKIVIERKNSLEELSSNLSKGRERFKRELERAKGAKFILLIEGACYDKIVSHDYDTDLNPKSFVGTLAAFKNRYGISVEYVRSNKYSGNFMMVEFKAYLREWLKNELF